MPMWVKVMHWLGRCPRCAVHDTPEGIGGKCIDCGRVHGWVTRDELRAYADRSMRSALRKSVTVVHKATR